MIPHTRRDAGIVNVCNIRKLNVYKQYDKPNNLLYGAGSYRL